MALINHAKREINAKLVYYGPGLSGKTANLEFIYRKIKPDCRGAMKSLATQGDRMLFFDFIPPEQAGFAGYTVRFHIYTSPGQVLSPTTWKMVLKGVDGVVYVADARREALSAAKESFEKLAGILSGYGKGVNDIPMIVQCNKSDLAGAVSPEEMRGALGAGEIPIMPASALLGKGVLGALSTLVRMVMDRIRTVDLAGGAEEMAAPELPAEEESAASPAVESVQAAPEVSGDNVEIAFDGAVEDLGGGALRLPLLVKAGGAEQRMAVRISIAFEVEK